MHLVAPGWNAIGAGEPALPGIALGHNDASRFGFTIVGIDQQDLYVERLNPAESGPNTGIAARGSRMEIERQPIRVKGGASPDRGTALHRARPRDPRGPRAASRLRAAMGGERAGRRRAIWPALAVARASNWSEFLGAMERYKVPSENIVYADTWMATSAGRPRAWRPSARTGPACFPCPARPASTNGAGFRRLAELPRLYNPPAHFIATANHNILPRRLPHPLGYEWAHAVPLPAHPRDAHRAPQILGRRISSACSRTWSRCRRAASRRWCGDGTAARGRARQMVDMLLAWDCRITAQSPEALLYELWIARLPEALLARGWA